MSGTPGPAAADSSHKAASPVVRRGPGGLRFAIRTTFYAPYHFGGDAAFLRRRGLARPGHQGT